MNFLNLVKQRRSCRRYSSQAVPLESLERCLEASRLAPSACNSQPWRFIVITDPVLKNQVAQNAFSGIYQFNSFAKTAPVLVVVIREDSAYMAKLGGALRGVQYSLIDLGIACEHFVLQAAEEGLGTCWIGWFDSKAVKKVLNLPAKVRVDVLLCLGYDETRAGMIPDSKIRKSFSEMTEIR